ncbi:TIGR04283 family arsenosugar biosynthesis glycosyltransferase [Candidatus Latescibacterota bacterium]
MTQKDLIIVFTRYPAPGTTKTRMIPTLGEEGAARLQRKMTLKTVAVCEQYSLKARAAVEIRYAFHDKNDEHLMKRWLGATRRYKLQADGDLGARMGNAFTEAFHNGGRRVIIVGTDSPDLNSGHLRSAFDMLNQSDMVLGPAFDGGYYLIGLRNNAPLKAISGLFENISWGTSTVLDETVNNAGLLGISHGLLETLHDVDRPVDILIWERTQKKLSVIIPTLNEKEHIADTIKQIEKGTNIEIIAVDGGSTDGTPEIIKEQGIRCHKSPKGRSNQMNHGFAKSTGKYVLFLHADTILPEDYDVIVRSALDADNIICGAFKLGIDTPGIKLRIIEAATHFRAKYMQMPYGDQALFMMRQTFDELGGFPDMPVMEDYEFVRRMKRSGRIGIVPSKVITSGRRWEKRGVVRTTLINQLVIVGYLLGVSTEKLARLYYGKQ